MGGGRKNDLYYMTNRLKSIPALKNLGLTKPNSSNSVATLDAETEKFLETASFLSKADKEYFRKEYKGESKRSQTLLSFIPFQSPKTLQEVEENKRVLIQKNERVPWLATTKIHAATQSLYLVERAR